MITSVAAWFPELPPLAITRGMKAMSHSWGDFQRANTMAVTAAVANRIVSQMPRFQVIETRAASR